MKRKRASTKKLQVIRCGSYERRIIYYGGAAAPDASPQQRRARQLEGRHISSEKKRLSNFRAAKNKFRALVYGNVTPEWSIVTLTYDNEHAPQNKKGVRPSWRQFSNLARRWANERGMDFKYFRVIEDKHGAGRPHIHLLCNIPISMREAFLTLWAFGCYECQDMRQVDTDPGGNVDAEGLTRYLNKERRNLDERLYTTSRNLNKIEKLPPEPIPNETEIEDIALPENHYILDRQEWRGLYGYIGAIDFIVPQRE